MTLTDNPRVDIEKRIKQLKNRETLIMALRRRYCKYSSLGGFKRGEKSLRDTRKELDLRYKQLQEFNKCPNLIFWPLKNQTL